MTNPDGLTISASFDRAYAWSGGGSVRYLAVEVTAPSVEHDEPPRPVNVALVIDASGSMAGPNLAAARQAATTVANSLGDQDILSVVSFADDTVLHVDGVRLTATGKSAAANAIARIADRGRTNLSAGWFKGAECAAVVMETNPGLTNRVVLLSDGHANAGIINPDVLATHARELAQRGLQTSTVGVGDGYSEAQISVIAEAGGGRMHDAERPHEIAEVVVADLRELQATSAELVHIHLQLPDGVRAECISGFPVEERAQALTANLGAMVSGGKRTAFFRLFLPKGVAGEDLVFRCPATWRRPGSDTELETGAACAVIEFAEEPKNGAQPRDIAISEGVARTWQSTVTRKVVQLNAAGAGAEIRHYLQQELTFFCAYCEGLPGVAVLVEELELMYANADQDWGSRNRKELHLMSQNQVYGRTESRRNARSAGKASYVGERHPGAVGTMAWLIQGHTVAVVDGKRCLIDTGSPVSIGDGSITFGQRTFPLMQSFNGFDMDELRKLARIPVQALLGADILGSAPFVLEMTSGGAGALTVGRYPEGPGWSYFPASFVSGVPLIDIAVNGAERRAFLDTGAKVSYLRRGLLEGLTPVGTARDFYPGFGSFSTKLYPVQIQLDGKDFEIQAGRLPRALEPMLDAAGAEAIIGASILRFANLGFDIPNGVVAASVH